MLVGCTDSRDIQKLESRCLMVVIIQKPPSRSRFCTTAVPVLVILRQEKAILESLMIPLKVIVRHELSDRVFATHPR
jgi:hypothetical protein